jgi:hypothetical protein
MVDYTVGDGYVLPLDNSYKLSRLRKRHPARVWQRLKHDFGFSISEPQYGIISTYRTSCRYSVPIRIARVFLPLLAPERIDVPWYSSTSRGELRYNKLFEEYIERQGHESETEIFKEIERVDYIRRRAWQLGTYPCVGRFWFLRSIFAATPYYDQILDHVQGGAVVLDVACGMGQELRRLREDGAKGRMYAVDIQKGMWNLGLELFKDDKYPPATFVRTDVRDRKRMQEQFTNKIDIIMMCQFLDLSDGYGQESILTSLISISKIGTKVTGWMLGTTRYEAGEHEYKGSRGRRFIHCQLTFKFLWQNVACKTNTKWRVESSLVELTDLGFGPDEFSWMDAPKLEAFCFVVTRES